MAESPLSRALHAIEQGRDDDVHEALAEAWRQRRSPSIKRLAALADVRSASPMRGRLSALGASRVALVLDALRGFEDEDDPLFASWVLAALEAPPFAGPSSRPLIEVLIDTSKRLCDPDLAVRAAHIARVWAVRVTPKPSRVALTKRLEDAAASIVAIELRGPTDEEARLEASVLEKLRPITSRQTTEASLLAEIYANPTDDGPRLVLADMLLERGDERGELIALQFKRRDSALDDEAAAREALLLKKHGKLWLGPLAPVISFGKSYSRSRFERGFLAAADFIQVVEKKLGLVIDEPAWAVVEELCGAWPRELIFRAPLRGLRRIELATVLIEELIAKRVTFPNVVELATGSSPDDFQALSGVFPALETLIVLFPHGPRVEDIALLSALPVRRLVFRRHPDRHEPISAVPFDALLDSVLALPAAAPELALEPPWKKWPRPSPVELRVVSGRYQRIEGLGIP
jgi:uncharacterized protein (TIGR02996 family)